MNFSDRVPPLHLGLRVLTYFCPGADCHTSFDGFLDFILLFIGVGGQVLPLKNFLVKS